MNKDMKQESLFNGQKNEMADQITEEISADRTESEDFSQDEEKEEARNEQQPRHVRRESAVSKEGKANRSLPNKIATSGVFGFFMIVTAILFCAFTGHFSGDSSVNESEEAKQALEEHQSTKLKAGTVLLENDEIIEAKDYDVVHKSNGKNTTMWVWDYAGEDGDYIKIYVDGKAITDSFMIKNKPKKYTVPAIGEVKVQGIRDGGGGITYAVRFKANNTTYFNQADENKGENTYTLMLDS